MLQVYFLSFGPYFRCWADMVKFQQSTPRPFYYARPEKWGSLFRIALSSKGEVVYSELCFLWQRGSGRCLVISVAISCVSAESIFLESLRKQQRLPDWDSMVALILNPAAVASPVLTQKDLQVSEVMVATWRPRPAAGSEPGPEHVAWRFLYRLAWLLQASHHSPARSFLAYTRQHQTQLSAAETRPKHCFRSKRHKPECDISVLVLTSCLTRGQALTNVHRGLVFSPEDGNKMRPVFPDHDEHFLTLNPRPFITHNSGFLLIQAVNQYNLYIQRKLSSFLFDDQVHTMICDMLSPGCGLCKKGPTGTRATRQGSEDWHMFL